MADNTIKGVFARNLVHYLTLYDMQQLELARRIGAGAATVNDWIKGRSTPRMAMLQRLTEVFDCELGDLLGDASDRGADREELSEEARDLARLYGQLDHYGRQAVRRIAEAERDRCRDEERFLRRAQDAPAPKVINLFEDPAAAGLLLGLTDQSCVPYALLPTDPPGAAYAVRIRGDSMAPDFPDGSIAFVNHDRMHDGDVGIFCVDGATLIKQWHHDPILGVTYLFSLNRLRSDADVVLGPEAAGGLIWQGRVITRRRYPLPER